MDKVINSCSNHIDELLDFFLDETCIMPIMEEIVDKSITCYECQKQAMYKLLGSGVKAIWD